MPACTWVQIASYTVPTSSIDWTFVPMKSKVCLIMDKSNINRHLFNGAFLSPMNLILLIDFFITCGETRKQKEYAFGTQLIETPFCIKPIAV